VKGGHRETGAPRWRKSSLGLIAPASRPSTPSGTEGAVFICPAGRTCDWPSFACSITVMTRPLISPAFRSYLSMSMFEPMRSRPCRPRYSPRRGLVQSRSAQLRVRGLSAPKTTPAPRAGGAPTRPLPYTSAAENPHRGPRGRARLSFFAPVQVYLGIIAPRPRSSTPGDQRPGISRLGRFGTENMFSA